MRSYDTDPKSDTVPVALLRHSHSGLSFNSIILLFLSFHSTMKLTPPENGLCKTAR